MSVRRGRRTGGRRPAGRGALERLWAPWRVAYLDRAGEPAECLFCRVAGARDDRRHLVLARRPHAFLMLNRFPYTGGHLMVAVAAHRGRFAGLSAAGRGRSLDFTRTGIGRVSSPCGGVRRSRRWRRRPRRRC